MAALAVAIAVAWLAHEVRGQSDLLRRLVDKPCLERRAVVSPSQAPNQYRKKAKQAPKLINGVPADRVITYESFFRQWEPGFAAQAEVRCWKALEQKYPKADLQPMTHFYLTVDAAGAVKAVKPDVTEPVHEDELIGLELHRCVAALIRTMRFPAPGKQTTGRVQANRGSAPSGH